VSIDIHPENGLGKDANCALLTPGHHFEESEPQFESKTMVFVYTRLYEPVVLQVIVIGKVVL
jgi:hypothetical protein